MRRALLLAVLAACGDSTNKCGQTCAHTDALVLVDTPIFTGDPLIDVGTVELVQGGYMFLEGPQWRDEMGDLLFSDIPANTIYKYTPGAGAPTVHRMPSGNSNGLAIVEGSAVFAAQHGTRSVTADGSALVTMYMGMQLNSPNDVVVHPDLTLYFTDPPYGLTNPNMSDLGFMGVFRYTTDGTLTVEHMGAMTERPNGIGISPDGNTIYVDDTDDGNLYKFARNADGTLAPRTMLAMTSGGPDGLAIDAAGNIFVATSAGIDVFAPSGMKWGTIAVPMQPSNCAFGDGDHKTLYITARTALYKVRLANPGLHTH